MLLPFNWRFYSLKHLHNQRENVSESSLETLKEENVGLWDLGLELWVSYLFYGERDLGANAVAREQCGGDDLFVIGVARERSALL